MANRERTIYTKSIGQRDHLWYNDALERNIYVVEHQAAVDVSDATRDLNDDEITTTTMNSGGRSLDQSLVGGFSFDQETPVFLETDFSLDDTVEHRRMHQCLKEQWSAGAADRKKTPNSSSSARQKKALSASCPTLDKSAALSVAPSTVTVDSRLLVDNEDDGTLHKSMLNLSNTDRTTALPLSSSATSTSFAIGIADDDDDVGLTSSAVGFPVTSAHPSEASVQICINDVSLDNSDDFCVVSCDEDDMNVEIIRRQKRRSSWCPEKERKRDEREEKQRMLGINGRSQSLSSLEGQDDSDDSEDEDDDEDATGSLAKQINPTSKSYVRKNQTGAVNSLSANAGNYSGSTLLVAASSNTNCGILNGSSSQRTASQDEWRGFSVDQKDSADVTTRGKMVGEIDDNAAMKPHQTCRRVVSAVDRNVDMTSTLKTNPNAGGESCNSHSTSNLNGFIGDETETSPRTERSGSNAEIQFHKFTEGKEEKSRRRSSVFSKISSYRNKKVVKTSKSFKNSHQFVSVSVSNSTACNVCGKCLSNKPALQCENCAMNVHESSCLDQAQLCPRSSSKFLITTMKDEIMFSKREGTRVDDDDTPDGPKLPSRVNSSSNFSSHSSESLEEISTNATELDDDVDVLFRENDPEAWSVTVDKKTLKKMTAKDIKRQDHIWELIQTERNNFRTLKIMQKVFADGMVREIGFCREIVDQVFPKLDDLLEIHSILLKSFIRLQDERADRSIELIGDVLVQLFQGKTASLMKAAYGEFCSRQSESVGFYKELRRTDRRFQTFIEKCSHRNVCRRLGVDECILLVTQRLTKYPLLIEPIIKTTIDVQEREQLNSALSLVKDIIISVNKHVDAYVRHVRLNEILVKLDQKSSTIYRGNKFKKSDLLIPERKLHHEGTIKWMSARGKSCEVLAVVLSDVMFFVTESNQKYYFFSQDNKSGVVSLSKLLVREKDDMRDSRGFYLICSSREPEMYELVCRSTEERSQWMAILKDAIWKCSQDQFGNYRVSQEPLNSIQDIDPSMIQRKIDDLHKKDEVVAATLGEKSKLISEILETFSQSNNLLPGNMTDASEMSDPSPLLNTILQLETRLMEALQQINVCVHQSIDASSSSDVSSSLGLLPKRAETFSGFENKEKDLTIRKRNASGYDSLLQNNGEPPSDIKSLRRASLIITPSQRETKFLTNGDNKSSRRMSANLLPNMLNRLHREKDLFPRQTMTTGAGNQSDQDNNSLPASSSSYRPLSSDWTEVLIRDVCDSLAQISTRVHSLANFISHQSTDLQRVNAHLTIAQDKLSNVNKENEMMKNDKRTVGYQNHKQLEELRNLQGLIQKQKVELHAMKEKQELELQDQREEIQKQQEDIDRQNAEMKTHKEELQRQKDALQRQMDLFEEQKMMTSRSLSPMNLTMRNGLDSLTRRPPRTSSNAASAVRPAPDDSTHVLEPTPPMLSNASNLSSTVYADFVPPSKAVEGGGSRPNASSLQDRIGRGGSVAMGAGDTLRRENFPLHLLSAANESKLGQAAAGGGNGLSPKPERGAAAAATGRPSVGNKPPVQQMIPMKLSTSRSTGRIDVGAGGGPPQEQRAASTAKDEDDKKSSSSSSGKTMSKNYSESRIGSFPAEGQKIAVNPSGVGGVQLASVSHLSKSQPSINDATSSRSTGNILPMKLVERSKVTSQSANSSPTRLLLSSIASANSRLPMSSGAAGTKPKPANEKKEFDIIYF